MQCLHQPSILFRESADMTAASVCLAGLPTLGPEATVSEDCADGQLERPPGGARRCPAVIEHVEHPVAVVEPLQVWEQFMGVRRMSVMDLHLPPEMSE